MDKNYEKQVYAAVLGKIIGVYMGRPFEGWTMERIRDTWGMVDRYVHEDRGVPLVVTDDDISGTFTFVRALEDSGLYADTQADFFGKTWLNYLLEKQTILWWGGMSCSTEHTAYLRLKAGVPSPRSGSMELNGKEVSEQIGAQIFIDAFGMVAPDNPALAVDLARKAAGVSHDGEAINGACIVAAMVSMAFSCKDIDTLMDKAVQFIPQDSLIAQVHRDVRQWSEMNSDWHDTYQLIKEKYGYHIWGGGCHIIPNHALMVMAWAYSKNDFHKALSIICSAGWDTDCNAANVGTVSALIAGLEHLDDTYSFRKPFADALYLPTADGTDSVTDALSLSRHIADMGRRLNGESVPEPPKKGACHNFEMPGALQGYESDESTYIYRGNAFVDNVPAPEGFLGKHCLKFHFETGIGKKARIHTRISPATSSGISYNVLYTPRLYSGMTIHAAGRLLTDAKLRMYVELDNGQILFSQILPKGDFEEAWQVIFESGKIKFFGFEAEADTKSSGDALIDYVNFDGTAQINLPCFENIEDPKRIPGWISNLDIARCFSNDGFTRLGMNAENGILVCGSKYWGNIKFSCDLQIHAADRAGIILCWQGNQRHYRLEFTKNKTRIVLQNYGESVLAETDFVAAENQWYSLEANVKDGHLTLAVDGKELPAADCTVFQKGGAGFGFSYGMANFKNLNIIAESAQ